MGSLSSAFPPPLSRWRPLLFLSSLTREKKTTHGLKGPKRRERETTRQGRWRKRDRPREGRGGGEVEFKLNKFKTVLCNLDRCDVMGFNWVVAWALRAFNFLIDFGKNLRVLRSLFFLLSPSVQGGLLFFVGGPVSHVVQFVTHHITFENGP